MIEYTKPEARAWAKKNFVGVCGVAHPTFTSDLERINETAIAHDINLLKELGYDSTLLVTELAITPEENARVAEIAREVAGPDFGLFFHASFGTLEENIHAAKLAQEAGVDRALLSYPSGFYPTTADEIYEYTSAFCNSTDLAVMLFPIPLWGFERVHPAGMPVDFVRRVVDTIPNIVAVKAEQGFPSVPGVMEMYRHFRDEIVISAPIESDVIPLMSVLDLQFSGTSNTSWMSDYFPKAFGLARKGEWDAAMELYWKVHPARLANSAGASSYASGTNMLNRTMWKYQEWLAGFNGGPLRAPAMRIPDRFMSTFRKGLEASGLPVTTSEDREYFIGRNPA